MTDRPPVVLVHGLFAARVIMQPLRWQLRRAGLPAVTVKLPFLNMAEVRRSARLLGEQVELILSRSGHTRCDLVGVSLGGLLGLRYVLDLGGAARVRRLVALGTPVRGSWAAAAAVGLLGPIAPAARQCLPGSDFLRSLQDRELPAEVEIISVYGSFDPVAPASRCSIPGARNIEIRTFPQPLAHQSLIASSAALRTLVGLLKEP